MSLLSMSSSHESISTTDSRSPPLILPSGHRFRTRQPLTSYLNYNETTNLWIITIHTNQTQSESTTTCGGTRNSIDFKAFSFSSEYAAREMAHVYAPPKLMGSSQGGGRQTHCFNCDTKFQALSIQKRPCHCRNCGVLICRSCTVRWHKYMIPETYRYNCYPSKKKSSQQQERRRRRRHSNHVKVCKTCDYLSIAFKHALLDGNYEHASSLYQAGNINLRCPIMNVRKGNEIMLPIHYAAIGGSLNILSWLIDVHYCPIKIITTDGGGHYGRRRGGSGGRNTLRRTQELIQTSQGRHILDLAIAHRRVNILHYLVNQKRITMSSSSTSTSTNGGGRGDTRTRTSSGKDKRNKKASSDSSMALEAVLKAYPVQRNLGVSTFRSSSGGRSRMNTVNQRLGTKHVQEGSDYLFNISTSSFDDDDDDEDSDSDYLSDDDYEERNPAQQHTDDEESVVTTKQYPCIICYEHNIDCVLTPCGHQICCIECSRKIPKCPICTSACTGIRIFRP